MPMIVDPAAPKVTPPERVTSPDGWFAALVDRQWAGVVLSVDYTEGTTAFADAAAVWQVSITRQDPDATAPVPVRSADPAWAIEGAGTAFDHEAPLGVAVVYTATVQYADGSTGPSSSLSVTVAAPAADDDDDLWLKSLDTPGLSTRVMVVAWDAPTSAARTDSTDVAGSPYPAIAYDTFAAETGQVTIDVAPAQVDRVRELLRSGVLLTQVRPGYLTPDRYFVPGDITGPTPTGKLGSSEGYQFAFPIAPIARPETAGQPMRLPTWSWDLLAEQFATWDAVAASYASWASLSTNGVT